MTEPNIETIRAGVQLAADAADSFRRLEHAWGEPVDVNSTYRDWDRQLRMYNDWRAYVNGTGPKPNHSRAIHPKYSKHCLGLALDSDDWTSPGFIALATEHGWIRTAASDPTERHHFEYQWARDKHRGEPVPASSTIPNNQEESMFIAIVRKKDWYLVSGGKACLLGAASGARESGAPILNFVDDWAVNQLKKITTGIK